MSATFDDAENDDANVVSPESWKHPASSQVINIVSEAILHEPE